MSVLDYFSQSKVKTWRRCRKAFDYRYNQGLNRRTSPVALMRGVTLHGMLEAAIKGEDPFESLKEYEEQYKKLWDDERESYPEPQELKSMFHRYQAHWANDGLDYGGRAEIEITAEHRGIKFKGIIDALPDDAQGRRWLCDHKTHKVLPDEHTRFSDIQTVLYYWAMRENAEKVDGILWDYIRTKPPAIPEQLKSGGLSKRKNMDTDADTYLAEIHRLGLDEADYADILAQVSKNTFFRRIYLPTPNEELINSVVTDFFDSCEEILEAKHYARNMTRDCKSCSYYQVCSAEVRGLDSSFIRKQLFTVREDK